MPAPRRRGRSMVWRWHSRLERSALAVALCGGLADSLVGAGKYEAAREIAAQGLQLAQERGDRPGESILVNALGLIAMEQGDLTVAAAHFEASLIITREVGDPLAEGLRLNNLGSVYPRLGDYARARSHLEHGLQLARRIGHRSSEAALLLNTASVAHLQGDDTAALALANAAFDSAAAGSGQRDLEAYARLVAGPRRTRPGPASPAARAAYTESRDMLRALDSCAASRSRPRLGPGPGGAGRRTSWTWRLDTGGD